MSKPIKPFYSRTHTFCQNCTLLKEKVVCITVFVRLGLLYAKIGCDIIKQACDYFGR